jgi:transcription antitermination factor NusA-like protein
MPMHLPICEICASTGTLCSGCTARLASGRLSEHDVKISNALHSMREKYNLDSADFSKAIDLGGFVLVLTRGDVGKLIGKEGKVVSAISGSIGKRVRIAELGGDMKKTIADILTPAKLLGINKVFSAGKRGYKVRISSRDFRNLPMDVPSLEKALYSLLDANVKVVFE